MRHSNRIYKECCGSKFESDFNLKKPLLAGPFKQKNERI